MSELSGTLRQSPTWHQGAEMAQHARLRIDSGLKIYFCDPQSPWQQYVMKVGFYIAHCTVPGFVDKAEPRAEARSNA
jgi:hypothetical protein